MESTTSQWRSCRLIRVFYRLPHESMHRLKRCGHRVRIFCATFRTKLCNTRFKRQDLRREVVDSKMLLFYCSEIGQCSLSMWHIYYIQYFNNIILTNLPPKNVHVIRYTCYMYALFSNLCFAFHCIICILMKNRTVRMFKSAIVLTRFKKSINNKRLNSMSCSGLYTRIPRHCLLP